MRRLLLCAALASLAGCTPGGAAFEGLTLLRPGDIIKQQERATDRTNPDYVGTPEYFGPNDTIDRSLPSGKRPRDTKP